MSAAAAVEVSINELVELCAVDNDLFCRTFFPDAFTQSAAPFHAEIWDLLNDPNVPQLAIAAFRGSAKTTLFRACMAKRIAYGISSFLLLASETSTHSVSSLAWLKRYIEGSAGASTMFADTFGLEKGAKWSEDHIEVYHRPLDKMVSVRAVGVEGQVRGLNLGNKRPDFILLDDPEDEENSGSRDQRLKLRNLIYGALLNSLTPRTECPEAKVVLAQTPIAEGDLISECETDPSWTYRRFGCFVETATGDKVSSWPARFTKKALLDKQDSYRRKHMLSVFTREMECQLVSDEDCFFLPEWLRVYDTLPEWATAGSMTTIGAIDPVPPPSEAQQAAGMSRKDFEGLAAVGFSGRRAIILDLRMSRGHGPDWTTSSFFEMQSRWHCQSWRVEGVGYQRTLKWILEQGMKEKRQWVAIDSEADNRKKTIRIRQALSHVCTEGELWVRRDHLQFIEQFRSYPAVQHDDALDCVAMAVQRAIRMGVFGVMAELQQAEEEMEGVEEWLVAP